MRVSDWFGLMGGRTSVLVGATKNPAPFGAGFCDSWLLSAYTPDRPAPGGEVISTSTRIDAAAGAVGSVCRSVRRCNMGQEEHAVRGGVNSFIYSYCS